MEKVIQLVKQDPLRVQALDCVKQLDLPQCYLAAGFVRNLVWDNLHDKRILTPLNDIDVIYFDSDEVDDNRYLDLELHLSQIMPDVRWQVRNQARMHIRNGDQPYQDIVDAMSYWPEKETAVAIRKLSEHRYQCISAFGFESLFELDVTYNPKRRRLEFEERLEAKEWLTHWPKLNVVY
ncbi:nucleotidyltransferase family protein [Vibrio sp. T187]|uniref:nucleotidyltransferase family protein n=1 Tax=Vibrio TaxID=662 RepID=UPI0010C958F9|nr:MULTISPECIES: nucleotidyltransferase family protein [Vibrio]MBW3696694.1 nucleotidyltransferase family protein [Vibrio sp. T187]